MCLQLIHFAYNREPKYYFFDTRMIYDFYYVAVIFHFHSMQYFQSQGSVEGTAVLVISSGMYADNEVDHNEYSNFIARGNKLRRSCQVDSFFTECSS